MEFCVLNFQFLMMRQVCTLVCFFVVFGIVERRIDNRAPIMLMTTFVAFALVRLLTHTLQFLSLVLVLARQVVAAPSVPAARPILPIPKLFVRHLLVTTLPSAS
jgi:hypothetical protein